MLPLFAEGATIPKEFFTRESIGSLAAVVTMVIVVANGIQTIFSWNPRWLALLIAEVICFAGLLHTNEKPAVLDYVLTVVNGFLVFAAATGATSAGNGLVKGKPEPPKSPDVLTGGERTRRGFWTPWF